VVRHAGIAVAVAAGGWLPAPALAQGRLTLPAVAMPVRAAERTAPGARPLASESPEPAARQPASTHDSRTQYPWLMSNSYVGLNVGFLHYPFSTQQLESGHRAEAVRVGRAAGQAVLFGRHFNEYFSFQAAYTRPVRYVTYVNVNGTGSDKTVWMAFGEFALRGRLPIGDRVAVYGDAGLGLTSRRGFTIGDATVVRDSQYAAMVVGAGVEYHVNPAWDVVAGVTRIPANREDNQPRAVLLTGGIRYNLRPLPVERVVENAQTDSVFPENVIHLGFSTSSLGYGVNHFFAGRVPIFWGGHVEVDRGWAVHYQRNIFHTRKRLAVDLGASVSRWKSRQNGDRFTTLSVYPLLRLTVVRGRNADWFLMYSPAGPSRMTRKVVDDVETGTNRFTFQDMMGMGVFAGRRRSVMFSVAIVHFSNGNLFPRNPGVSVPLTFGLGYTF
jgi:hypothetical protein